jgi:hypothetical protein
VLIGIPIIAHIMVVIVGVGKKEVVLGENIRAAHIDTR